LRRSAIYLICAVATLAGCSASDESALPIAEQPIFEEVGPGAYYIDNDRDPETTLRVLFTIQDQGWRSWVGTFKENASDPGRPVALTVASPTHLFSDPCTLRARVTPGPTVKDFAEGLVAMSGFDLVEPISDVIAFGFPSKHLVMAVPDAEHDPDRGFVGCTDGEYHGWGAEPIGRPEPTLTRHYQGPHHTIELWILDVEGKRLAIEKSYFPDSPASLIDELEQLVESIRIEP
jgi:hypothetical protein